MSNQAYSMTSGMVLPLEAPVILQEAAPSGNVPISNDQADTQEAVSDDQPIIGRVSEKFPAAILQWNEWITLYADQYGLSPDLIASVMWQESGGESRAYSHSGAVGLMQVMPRDGLAANFICANGPCFAKRPTMDQLFDPEFNIEYGTRMLAGLVNRHGNLRDALKSYGPMDRGYSYADRVLSIYERYGTE